VSPGTTGEVWALWPDGSGNLYAGGDFLTIGGVQAQRIAKWDGVGWSALGGGFDQWVAAIAGNGSEVYAGGAFSTAGSLAVNNIARWDGSAWASVGAGTNGAVLAARFAPSGDLYVGGWFTAVDGSATAANYIARWDGVTWSALGQGMDGYVNDLAIDATGNVYAGGEFTRADNTTVNYVAVWDGSQWSALAQGLDGTVEALMVDGTDVYVGGRFTQAVGGVAASRIAKWNGTTWSAVGGGQTNFVQRLTRDPSGKIYVGTYTEGTTNTGSVVQYDGLGWQDLGLAEATPIGELMALTYYNGKVALGGAGGVYLWDTGAYTAPAKAMAVASDTATGAVYVVTLGYDDLVRLNHFGLPTEWAILLGTGAAGDVGVLFDSSTARGVALWSNGAEIRAVDFDKTAAMSAAHVVHVSSRGLFSVSEVGSGNLFPVLVVGEPLDLVRTTVPSNPP
jgi:hypothetical protein